MANRSEGEAFGQKWEGVFSMGWDVTPLEAKRTVTTPSNSMCVDLRVTQWVNHQPAI